MCSATCLSSGLRIPQGWGNVVRHLAFRPTPDGPIHTVDRRKETAVHGCDGSHQSEIWARDAAVVSDWRASVLGDATGDEDALLYDEVGGRAGDLCMKKPAMGGLFTFG